MSTKIACVRGIVLPVDVVELALGDAVVDVDGGEEELALLGHLLETVDTGGGLLRDTDELLDDLVPVLGVLKNKEAHGIF